MVAVGTGCIALFAIVGAFRVAAGTVPPEDLVPTLVMVVVGIAALTSRRPLVVPASWTVLVLIAISGKVNEAAPARTSSIVGIVIMAVVAVAFTRRRRLTSLVAGTAATLAAPFWWYEAAGTTPAISGAVGMALAGTLFIVVRTASERNVDTARALFENSPIAILEQDWGPVLEWFAELRGQGVSDMGTYLARRPEAIGEAYARVRPLAMNAEARAAFLGWEAGDGRSLDHMTDEIRSACAEGLVDFFDGRFDRDVVFPMPHDGGRWARVTAFPHPAGGGRMLFAWSDVTKLKQAETDLAELVRSKDQFVAAISHELRTPLSP